MIWPVPGSVVKSAYADHGAIREATKHTPIRHMHGGIDLSGGTGVVLAACAGLVVLSQLKTTYNPGVVIIISRSHYKGQAIWLYSLYGHLSPDTVQSVRPGQKVLPGQIIGRTATPAEIAKGAIFNKTNPDMGQHLHFELRNSLYGMLGFSKIKYYYDPYEFLINDTLVIGTRAGATYPWSG